MFYVDEFGRLRDDSKKEIHPVVPPQPKIDRSSKWPEFLRGLLKAHPLCEGCSRKAETGHHVKPFHLYPDLELEPSNIAIVCLPCHFVICHTGNWSLYVVTAREDLSLHLIRVKAAQDLADHTS